MRKAMRWQPREQRGSRLRNTTLATLSPLVSEGHLPRTLYGTGSVADSNTSRYRSRIE
jgi:hypothetical protein